MSRGRAALLISAFAALALAGCQKKGASGGGECAAFGAFTTDAFARANAAVPDAERNAAHSAGEIGGWHKKLGRAFDAEAAAPPSFSSPKVKDWEAHYKRTFTLTASALRKMADGLERADKTAYRAGKDEQTAAGRERQRIIDDWKRHCTE